MLLNDRYEIGPKLGHGGMGAVFRAFDKRLERQVAVKVMGSSLQELGEKGRARFLREARAIAQLNHPNILDVYDVGEDQGEPFIVMELIEGQSLYERPPRDLEEIIGITRQICAALEHAHSHGIVHRDLKPGNILITQQGHVKLMDFGLARLVFASNLTSGQTLIGTPLYMAPEQALGQELDGRADLYALGVMLYEWMTGHYPFNDADAMAIVAQHIHAPVVPPRTLRPDLPPALEAIILKLMAKTPAERFASAQEVSQALTEPATASLLKPGPATPPAQLPVPATSFIGREEELAKVTAQLANKHCRLLTILGHGGVGKTRLALQAAAQVESKNFRDGVYFLSLESLTAPEFIVPAVAATLHITLQNPQTAKEQLLTYLRSKQLLLLMDNFESLMEGAHWVMETLQACREVKILATSRERLNLAEEWIVSLEGFPVPGDVAPATFENNSAVQLFWQRAYRANSRFRVTAADRPAVARICQLVDGMPLALELAAAWAKMMSCEEIAAQIERDLDFLNTTLRNVPDRHRSLRAVFEGSWKLLTEDEQRLCRLLSVFRGGFRREAAAAVLSPKPQVPSPKSEVRSQESEVESGKWQVAGGMPQGAEPATSDHLRPATSNQPPPSASPQPPAANNQSLITKNFEFALLETLSALMDKSLLRVTSSGRYEQHPLTHQYTTEKLAAAAPDEKAEVEERHAHYYADFLQREVTRMKGQGASQTEIMEEIHEEIDNVRAAWRWTITTGETIGEFWEAYRYSILSGIGMK
jgi:serine/threonine-protein kinase PknK